MNIYIEHSTVAAFHCFILSLQAGSLKRGPLVCPHTAVSVTWGTNPWLATKFLSFAMLLFTVVLKLCHFIMSLWESVVSDLFCSLCVTTCRSRYVLNFKVWNKDRTMHAARGVWNVPSLSASGPQGHQSADGSLGQCVCVCVCLCEHKHSCTRWLNLYLFICTCVCVSVCRSN